MRLIYKIFSIFERCFAFLQGKGYPASLKREVSILLSCTKGKANLAIDIGGNIGIYSQEILKKIPNIELHIFEPSLKNIEILNSKFENHSTVTINCLAVTEKTGQATLFANESGSGLASLSKRRLDHFNITFNESESVSTIKFEEYWIQKLNCRVIDLIKIDVEGHELSVLKGFGAALPRSKAIQFEFGGTCIDTRTFFQDFWYFFSENNFSIYRITPFGLQKMFAYKEFDESFYYTNFIAVNNLDLC